MLPFNARHIHAVITSLAPIHGVSMGRRDDKSTWRIDFKDEATKEQRDAALAALAAIDVANVEAQEQIKADRAAQRQAKLLDLAERMIDDPTLIDRVR